MRFICDSMLGKLAKYLRMLGFDAVYARSDAGLERYGREADDRILLTRRTKAKGFAKTIVIRSESVREQLKEIRGVIQSSLGSESVLNRCLECNAELVVADKKEIESLVPEFIYHHYASFKQCPSCTRVYWEGSHAKGMDQLLRGDPRLMAFPFAKLVDRLKMFYHADAPVLTRLAAKQRDPFLVLIGCLLSLRTKDETTEKAMERLMERARTPEELLAIPTDEIEKIIYPVGFYRNKSLLIKEISKTIIEKYHRIVPDTIEELTTIRGIGRKTANIVVTEGFGKPGVAVDTHVHRISNRLGAVKTKTPNQTEEALRKSLPQKYWLAYNPLLVTHGRTICTPLSPFCSRCPVFDLCARTGVTKSR